MYPRRIILQQPNTLTHVFFRCHNRQMFLGPSAIKDFLLLLIARNKTKYQIRVIDFIIMDNHAHFVFKINSAELLGHFMRTVNSQLARKINSYFDRDSQAIRERYKSPMICNEKYLLNTIQYIWMNRFRVNKKMRPESDRYCSAYWRLNNPYLLKSKPETKEDRDHNFLSNLLDSYDYLGFCRKRETKKFVIQLINHAISEIAKLSAHIFTNSHTISDQCTVSYRRELVRSFKRGQAPPIPAHASYL